MITLETDGNNLIISDKLGINCIIYLPFIRRMRSNSDAFNRRLLKNNWLTRREQDEVISFIHKLK